MTRILWALTGFVFIIGCTSQEKGVTTKSGVVLNFIEEGQGPAPSVGQVMTLHMFYEDENGKPVFDTRESGSASPLVYDTARWKGQGLLYEALALLKVGDSATFEIPTQDLFDNTFRNVVPDSMNADGYIKFYVGVVDVMSQRDYANQVDTKQLSIDGAIIDQYLSDNNIEAITTDSGLRYVISQAGSGPNAAPGNEVSVHYHGTLLDGTKFDSSYDRGSPFSFVLGQGMVIKGWDEGIALLNKGAKATLYIPSPLAYGPRGSGGAIGPDAVLKFDVELVDFE